MKKLQFWRSATLACVTVYVLIYAGICLWAAQSSKNSQWLTEQEANPTIGLGYLDMNDWCAILASASFRDKSKDERISMAEAKFNERKGVAEESGYNLKALREWFYKTANDFEKYPIKSFVFSQNSSPQFYRDLQNSGFPKANVFRVFIRHLTDKSSARDALIVLPFVMILLALILGVFVSIFTKVLAIRYKILVVGLVAVCLLEALIIRFQEKQPVNLGTFQLTDMGHYVTAEGTWTSDTNLADPLQVSKLDCSQNMGYCIEANARVSNGHLRVYTDYWQISDWGQDVLTVKDRDSALCVNESLRVDRKNKVVTFIRATKQPKPDSCGMIQDEPIVMHLTDGIGVQFKKR